MVRQKKILIVDDDPFNQKAVLTILDSFDIFESVCKTAFNGQEALDIIKDNISQNNNNDCNFDLIIMDFQMPIMDGNEATEKIREHIYSHDLNQPIICGCTGHMEESYVQRSIKSGMN